MGINVMYTSIILKILVSYYEVHILGKKQHFATLREKPALNKCFLLMNMKTRETVFPL